MKIIILLFTILSFAYAKQYVFMINKYDKEIDLEAKIISKIAKSSLKSDIKLYIPNISKQEKEIYSKYFSLSNDCESANFVFDKNRPMHSKCDNTKRLYFTNNYKKLLLDKKYYGAFFWNKSRPNIVFFKQRLKAKNIKLAKEYAQFIEDTDD